MATGRIPDPNSAPITAKGDLYTYSTVPARLAVGSNDQVLTVDSSTATGLKWATPASVPITWTQRTVLTNSISTIAYNGTNLYVAAGAAGQLATSSNGITWTARTSGFGTNGIAKVAFGNGLWVAVGQNGTLTTSTDGITWTARTSNMSTNYINSVTYANSIWVAVGNGGGTTNTGGIIYSTDGITWTRKSQSLTVGTSYYGLTYNGSNWIAVGNIATNNYLYASTPSGTWTAGADGSGQDLYDAFYDGTRTVVTTSTGLLRFSTSATFGTFTTFEGVTVNTEIIRQVSFYYDGKVFNIGSGFTSISTTPLTGNYGNITNTMTLSPTTQMDSAGALVAAGNCVFAGAAGYIVGSTNPGLLFTSF